MNEWHDFFVATAGASAALTGLLFVGVSINLSRILAFPKLPNRALLSLILVTVVLLVSIVCLIPRQSYFAYGIQVMLIGLSCWIVSFFLNASIIKKTDAPYKKAGFFMMVLNQLATFPYLIAATLLLCNNQNGLYFIALAFILSIIKSITDAWVLLIEINR